MGRSIRLIACSTNKRCIDSRRVRCAFASKNAMANNDAARKSALVQRNYIVDLLEFYSNIIIICIMYIFENAFTHPTSSESSCTRLADALIHTPPKSRREIAFRHVCITHFSFVQGEKFVEYNVERGG